VNALQIQRQTGGGGRACQVEFLQPDHGPEGGDSNAQGLGRSISSEVISSEVGNIGEGNLSEGYGSDDGKGGERGLATELLSLGEASPSRPGDGSGGPGGAVTGAANVASAGGPPAGAPGQFRFELSAGAGLGLSAALRVTRVDAGSAAGAAGVCVGARLTALGGTEVATLDAFVAALRTLRAQAQSSRTSPGADASAAGLACEVHFEWPGNHSSATGPAAATAALPAAAPATTTTTREAGGPLLGPAAAPRGAGALRLLPGLRSLDVSQTGLGPEGAWLLGAGLRAGGARRLARSRRDSSRRNFLTGAALEFRGLVLPRRRTFFFVLPTFEF
jgi:hypothetical protein